MRLPIPSHRPITALAPMQDVTNLPFMSVIASYEAPDLFFTEYFRVHAHSTLEPHLLPAIANNQTGRPVFAQMIGESIPDLLRTVDALQAYPIAGIDLNMGCPAPRVYKKNVGGGLLRDIHNIDRILKALRSHISGLFTVKMRIGFEDTEAFNDLLDCINTHSIDLLSLHGRTVKQLYRGDVDYPLIGEAVKKINCPVLANGNITSYLKAEAVLTLTQAPGVMIGRSAIRNPWIFKQCHAFFENKPIYVPCLSDVYDYIDKLHTALLQPNIPEIVHISRLKKFLNFVGQSVDPNGSFLHDMRRTTSIKELFQVADNHLLKNADYPLSLEPYPNIIARPNCEDT
jgi:tRNA-dihydrouridine synthase B